jgi:signal transduction histidine kinase
MHAYDPGQSGTLTISTETEPDGMVRIAYKDDGKGIPREHQENVFDPFFTTKRGAGGTGLGLHVVFQIVTKTLGGRIKLLSEPGAGSKFVIRIPLQAATSYL